MAGLLRRFEALEGRSSTSSPDSAPLDRSPATAPLQQQAAGDAASSEGNEQARVHPALRSMSLPARHTQLSSSVPVSGSSDSQPLTAPSSFFSPLFSRRFTSLGGGKRASVDAQESAHSPTGAASSHAHSAPIKIGRQGHHGDEGTDTDMSPLSDATRMQSAAGAADDGGSGSASSSPGSKLALSTGTMQSEDFDQRFREWNDMVYSGSY